MTSSATEGLTVFPTIGKWPYKSFKRFQDYSNKETGGVYWVAIEKLLERSARLDMYELGLDEEEVIEQVAPEKPLTLGEYNE
jgi:hypothetical protein